MKEFLSGMKYALGMVLLIIIVKVILCGISIRWVTNETRHYNMAGTYNYSTYDVYGMHSGCLYGLKDVELEEDEPQKLQVKFGY